MTTKRFLTSVADVFAYDDSDTLLFTAKTLLDSSFDVKTGSTEVRGGRGSQLFYIYYHTAAATLALTDTQFNLAMLAETVGQSIGTGASVYTEETITLGASGSGTVTGTPIELPNSGNIYGWVSQVDGTTQRVTFNTKTFSSSTGTSGDSVCVRYYATNAAASSLVIPANILPASVHLVMEAQLNSGDVAGVNKIGIVQLDVPKAQLSGAFTISMKSDGVSNTPLTATMLASSDLTSAACSNVPVYATLKEILDDVNWYDDVTALAISGGDFTLATETGTQQLVVFAIKSGGEAPFQPPVADLEFTSDTTAKATVTLNGGLVQGVDTGTSLIHVIISDKDTIEASATCTVPAP